MKRYSPFVTAVASVAALICSSAAFAQGPQEAEELMKSGFTNVGSSVWERVEADGVIHRVGFGLESKDALLDRLKSYEAQLKATDAEETDVLTLLAMSSIVTSIQEHIRILEEAQASSANVKASGIFNGCTTSTISPSTSVNTASRTSNSTVGFIGFGPGVPGVIRLAFSFSRSGAASDSTTPDIDVVATYGSTFGPTTSVSSSTAGTGTCQLYAYGHSFNVFSGCGRWSDSYFAGTC